ncbi:MAG TPA: hypothetical protein VGC56_03130 [Allosphingosinicella sp.]
MLQPLILAWLIAAAPVGSEGVRPAGEAAAILEVVIRSEARDYGDIPGDVRPCVQSILAEPTFDSLRRSIAHPPKINLPPGGVLTAADFGPPSAEYPWDKLDPRDPTKLKRLDAAEQRELTSAVSRILKRGKLPPVARAVYPSSLAPPFARCKRDGQLPRLRLSAPDLAGELAFVQAEFECVLCGHGTLYALRRGTSGWEIVAEWTNWMS